MKNLGHLITHVCIFLIFVGASHAQNSLPSKRIGLISGGVSGTYARFAQDISDALDSEDFRVLPMLGKGSQQNIQDLIFIDEVDLAIVQSDVMTHYRDKDETGRIDASIHYITKLYNEEIHLVTRKDVGSLKALEGQPVAVGRSGSGTEMTSQIILNARDISILPINLGSREALENVKSGLISAAFFVVGKPSSLLASVTPEDGLKLLTIELPKSVEFPYFGAELKSSDYPGLVPTNQSVDTVAVGAILAVFNWREGLPNYKVLESFSNQFLDSLEIFKSSDGYHPKWGEVDPKIEVPGWTRFAPAAKRLQ